MTFVTVVVWGVFVVTSLMLLALIYLAIYEAFFQSELSKLMDRIENGVRVWDMWKVFLIFGVWFASGAYVFGAFG